MTCKDSVKWLESLKNDLGESQFCELWHYEQALTETIELLKSNRFIELPCIEGENLYYISKNNTIGCFLNASFESILMCVNDYHYGKVKFMATTREKAETRLKELMKNENA